LNLGEKQYLARILGSDAHSLNALGRNAENAKRVTRIKMDTPSFAALRLALEDCDARVRLEDQIPPAVPMIVGAHFDGGFLDGQTLHLSPNLNCIIGGRGTGKSTALEAIRCLSRSTSEDGVVDSEVWPDALYLFWRDTAGVQHALYRGSGESIQNLDDEINGPIGFDVDCFGQGDTARISAAAKKDPLALLEYLDRFTNAREPLAEEAEAIAQLQDSHIAIEAVEKQVADIPQYKRALELARKQIAALEKADARGLIELQRKLEEERALRQQVVTHLTALQKTCSPAMHPAAARLRAAAPQTPLTSGSAEFAAIIETVAAFEAQVTSPDRDASSDSGSSRPKRCGCSGTGVKSSMRNGCYSAPPRGLR
jgi:energy-coupling factor transporter ATP-binding protein EcfA2